MTTSALSTLHNAAATIAAYHSAVRLGILDRIDREPATIAEIAAGCGTSERGTRLLIAALTVTGLVEALPDGRFRPATSGLAALHPLLDLWRHLPESVRDGRPAVRADTVSGASRLYPHLVGHLARMYRIAPERAADLVGAATAVLDVGAGVAPWSIAFAARDPGCRVTALDLPDVLPVTRRAVEDAGRADQYDFVAGDVFRVDLPRATYDLILVANLCQLFDEEANRLLVARLTHALSPGGTLAVIGLVQQATPASSSQVLYELSLFLRTGTGELHSPQTCRRWFADAGLSPAISADIWPDPPMKLMTAR